MTAMELSFNDKASLTFNSSIGTHSPLLKKRCSGDLDTCTVGEFQGTHPSCHTVHDSFYLLVFLLARFLVVGQHRHAHLQLLNIRQPPLGVYLRTCREADRRGTLGSEDVEHERNVTVLQYNFP